MLDKMNAPRLPNYSRLVSDLSPKWNSLSFSIVLKLKLSFNIFNFLPYTVTVDGTGSAVLQEGLTSLKQRKSIVFSISTSIVLIGAYCPVR
jgi:hypothetical protein